MCPSIRFISYARGSSKGSQISYLTSYIDGIPRRQRDDIYQLCHIDIMGPLKEGNYCNRECPPRRIRAP
ncbi:hypothetical protein GJ744_011860 [Endocarpon pusillum]|uniref:Uncharacterized protein n=1 Tax=Endocarpon pusillum TaxID=364733 RepID=A0A8H7E0T2_9EURO|nr:hypothetical protein GJ744_011860 [Endocarpon pusillum]